MIGNPHLLCAQSADEDDSTVLPTSRLGAETMVCELLAMSLVALDMLCVDMVWLYHAFDFCVLWCGVENAFLHSFIASHHSCIHSLHCIIHAFMHAFIAFHLIYVRESMWMWLCVYVF